MTDQHRATTEQWATQKALQRLTFHGACIDQLLHRIEKLEAQYETQRHTPGDQAPTGSLVERVCIEAGIHNPADARAAIRVAAAWLRQQDPEPDRLGRLLGQLSTPCSVMADLLDNEANR